MCVSVRIPTILRTYTGGESEVTASGATLAEVLDDLDGNHSGIKGRILDEAGELRRFVNVYVGNDDVRFSTTWPPPTPDGTQVSVIPAVARRLMTAFGPSAPDDPAAESLTPGGEARHSGRGNAPTSPRTNEGWTARWPRATWGSARRGRRYAGRAPPYGGPGTPRRPGSAVRTSGIRVAAAY